MTQDAKLDGCKIRYLSIHMSNTNTPSISYSGVGAGNRLGLTRERRLSDKITAGGIAPNILNAPTGITQRKTKDDTISLCGPKLIIELHHSYFSINQVADKTLMIAYNVNQENLVG